jgi:acyclic terpene utilization AtuA family protein
MMAKQAMSARRPPLRIANSSGFYGDRFAAPLEMLTGGPIDVLTGDYLAELTLFILWKARQKDPDAGYAASFLGQMEEALGSALERGVKIVTNAGGLNPAGLAARLREIAGRLGLAPRIAHVEGDDLLPRLSSLQAEGHPLAHLDTGRPLAALVPPVATANAYLGAWPIVEALRAGADVVVCGRVTDASLVVGPAAWHFGWARDDWDRLAGAVVAGHVIECGAQATGGNYAFFRDVPGLEHPGFPIAEVHEDGRAVITKHPGTGGRVSRGTVTAQLLYEIDGPRYLSPDAVARFDTIRLDEEGEDRVLVSGVRGEPPPSQLKVCLNYLGGYRNTLTLALTGLDVEEKAALARRTLFGALGGEGRFAEVRVDLVRVDQPDADTEETASALLRVTVKDPDPRRVGRAFSGAAVEMALASYPGLFGASAPGDASAYGVYWPTVVPAEVVEAVVVMDDGSRLSVPSTPTPSGERAAVAEPPGLPRAPGGPTRRAPLGTVYGARSGDKGGNANVGVWAPSAPAYAWLAETLTVARFKALLPETGECPVERHQLPNLLALNFVVRGLLGDGVAASVRFDPQAKALGEHLRSRLVDLPVALLDAVSRPAP